MFLGRFINGNGLILPNNITAPGIEKILDMAFRDDSHDFWVGLCQGVYDPDMLIQDLTEPTIGVNGYARQQITRDETGWPVDGRANNEPFLESLDLVWAASGGDFDEAITRMFICHDETATTGAVFALSASLPDELTIGTDTDIGDRTYKYRIYGR
jgi:hypothetical protein